MAKTFTQVFYSLVPSWLSSGDGGKILHSLARIKDVLVHRARLGLNARFPTRAGSSALALIGADRVILRGRSETSAHYAERLTRWRYPRAHRIRGSAFALLDQIAEYVGGAAVYTVDARRNWHGRDTLGPGVGDEDYAYNWFQNVMFDALDPAVHWARFSVVLGANPDLPWLTDNPNFGDPALWGGAVGTPGYCVGLSGWNPTDTTNMRKLFRGAQQWRPHGTRAEWLIVQLTPWAGWLPTIDATWERWATIQAGVRTSTRSPDCRYISLSPTINNAFTGDPTQFADATQMPGGAPNEPGDPTVFSATTTLPDGTTYTGNPSNFTERVQLFDDGDQT